MFYQSAKANVNHNGHGIVGNALRNDDAFTPHGRTASKMSVAETNAEFERLAKEQKNA